MRIPALLFSILIGLANWKLTAAEFEARTFQVPNGISLPYRLLKPEPYNPSQKYPLVVFFHGSGERGTDNSKQVGAISNLFNRPEVLKQFPCFVVAPQCPEDKQWVEMPWSGESGNAPKATSPLQLTVLGMMDNLAREYSLDPDRTYITGLSMGGYSTWDLITRFPNRWAAAAPICGGGETARASLAKPVPVWAFHGTEDTVVLPVRTRDMVNGLRAAGGNVVQTDYPGISHDSWTSAYSEPGLLPWMFAQRRGKMPDMDLAIAQNHLPIPPEQFVPGKGPLRNEDWFRALWMKRRSEFAAAIKADQGTVVFLGDSITQGLESLATDFPQYKTANRGIAGDTSRGVLYRLPGDVLSLRPRAVSLLIGTNDLSQNADPAIIAGNIRAIIASLQAQNPKIPLIVNRVMPREVSPGLFPEQIRALNLLIDELVKSDPRLTLCDSWSVFEDGNGTSKPEEFPDGVHPNPAAYAKWKAALEVAFKKAGL